MKISTILDHADSGHIALPEFQRGYVWNRDQVRTLFDSLYRRHPVGGLLVWVTEAKTTVHRGDGPVAGIVKLLLDGQQRITSLYGVARGRPPKFFDGNAEAFTDLRFHLGTETFTFYQPVKMREDPLWIDVSELMQGGTAGLGRFVNKLSTIPAHAENIGLFVGRLSQLLGILDIDLHVEEITGADKTLDVIVNIFNRVNSGGTKLSKGDLALAKICAEWPDARNAMKTSLMQWNRAGYDFTLDWLLRSVNTVLTGEAQFLYLHDKTATEIQSAFKRAVKHIDDILNLIAGRLGLDHDRVFFGRYAVPVMVRFLEISKGRRDFRQQDKLLFWYVQAAMWGRFSGSTESAIDQDLAALEGPNGGLDALVEQLRLGRGGLSVEAAHFNASTLGARFYPVLYMLTRMGAARDWGTGVPLKANLLGKMSRLEVHHIFPKTQLYKAGYDRAAVHALANYCFLSKDTNLKIRDRLPEEYFPEVEKNHPGALASQWIPLDPQLWKIERYLDFLAARRALLAEETNRRLADLLHGETHWLGQPAVIPAASTEVAISGITSEEEEQELVALNAWVERHGLPRGQVAFDYADPVTGTQKAVFDLAWPDGLQPGLSPPVAVLLNESAEVLRLASAAGFRCFTTPAEFRAYVKAEILKDEAA